MTVGAYCRRRALAIMFWDVASPRACACVRGTHEVCISNRCSLHVLQILPFFCGVSVVCNATHARGGG